MAAAGAHARDGEPSTLRSVVRQCLLDEMIQTASQSSPGWMVMVLDDHATRIISAVLRMYDIMEAGITLVEQLSRKRQGFPEMEVIYFLTPTEESVQKLLEDFPEGGEGARYGDVHLYFVSSVPDELVQRITANEALMQRVKAFKEVNLDYLAVESGCFHLDMPRSFHSLFAPESTAAGGCLMEIAQRMATVFVSQGQRPFVRHSMSPHARAIAQTVSNLLDAHVAANPDFNYLGRGDPAQRGVLLVLDRAEDPLSPLLHEFTYQAMVQDLLPVDEDKISYSTETNAGQTVEKEVLLNEGDPLWVEYRHTHIADVISQLSTRISEFVQHNSGAQLAQESGANMSLSEMAAAMRQLPEYRETMAKLAQHMHLAHRCMDQLTQTGLVDVANFEQTLATGADEEGRAVKPAQLAQQLGELLADGRHSDEIKLRLLAMYIISQAGISGEQRRELIGAAGVPDDALLNLQHLGVELQRSQQQSGGGGRGRFGLGRGRGNGGGAAAAGAHTNADAAYSMSRYVTHLKDLAEQLAANQLPEDAYPYHGQRAPAPAEAKNQVRSMRKHGRPDKTAQPAGGRYTIFMAGGIAFSEVRAVYEVKQATNTEMVVGATHFIKPADYIAGLAGLTDESEAVPSFNLA